MQKVKSETRIVAEKIQKITGQSLLSINFLSHLFMEQGKFSAEIDALNYMLELSQEEAV